MKLKVLIATLFVAGFASSFALAGGTRGAVDTTTGTTGNTTTGATDTTPKADKCKKVELKGSNGTGSVTFTVDKASKKSSGLKGTTVTLAISAARVQANACVDAAGVLTLRGLEVSAKKAEKTKDDKKK